MTSRARSRSTRCSSRWRASSGPAIAGLLLAQAGPTWVFVVDAASFLGVIVAVSLLPSAKRAADAAGAKLGGALREGFAYVFGQRSIAGLMALTFFAGIFGTPPVAFMMPAIATEVLDGGPGTLGALVGRDRPGIAPRVAAPARAREAPEQGRARAGRVLPHGRVDRAGRRVGHGRDLDRARGLRRVRRSAVRRPVDRGRPELGERRDARPGDGDLGRGLRRGAAVRRAADRRA